MVSTAMMESVFFKWMVIKNIRYLLVFITVLTPVVTILFITTSDTWGFIGRKSNYRSPETHALHVTTQVMSVAAHKMTLNPPSSKCLALKDIHNLVDDRPMDLTSGIPMDELEGTIFSDRSERIRDVVSRGNQELPSLLNRASNTSRINASLIDGLASLEIRSGDYIYLPGGHWRPASCKPAWKVAIVVPYRNRTFQLSIFLRYMIPFLQKQQLEFAIYIVNQENNIAFNRGILLNVGFLEALNFSRWDCFVFHDVDHLPQSEFNPYGCVDLPRHFIGGADNRNYRVPFKLSYGGVNGFNTSQFRQINGFSNVYWGWGCEDDDLGMRVVINGFKKIRYTGTVGHYKTIGAHHNKIKKELGTLEKTNRKLFKTMRSRLKTDGLNNVKYATPHLKLHALYTNISVNIQHW